MVPDDKEQAPAVGTIGGPSPGMNREFERSQAERRRLREMDERMRIASEAAVRTVLDEYFPAALPADLIGRVCRIQNGLIKQVVEKEKVIRELHDGINRIANEADQRFVDGFYECADQVDRHARETWVRPAVIDSLLRNDSRRRPDARRDRNRAASEQVEWSRD